MKLFFTAILLLIGGTFSPLFSDELEDYYLGPLQNLTESYSQPSPQDLPAEIYEVGARWYQGSQMPARATLRTYIKEVQELLGYCEIKGYIPWGATVLLATGDVQEDPPKGLVVLAKSRSRDAENIALLKLNVNRHWSNIDQAVAFNKPFSEKRTKVVWRGVDSGTYNLPRDQRPRFQLVHRWANSPDERVDVGFGRPSIAPMIYTPRVYKRADKLPEGSLKEGRPICWFLEHKYIISVEGNDKDSGLQWKLASNSVVLMPEPFFESWLREFQLQPYVHYVPVKSDFSDLLEQFTWCEENPASCEKIRTKAREYVLNLAKDPDDWDRQARVLKAFYDRHQKLGKARKTPF